jgi:hypothetical protein
VGVIDGNSTNQQIPGARSVYEFVLEELASISSINLTTVASLPATGDNSTIYLVKADKDTYTQYIYSASDNQWYDLGTTEVDLSGYLQEKDIEALNNAEIEGILENAGF